MKEKTWTMEEVLAMAGERVPMPASDDTTPPLPAGAPQNLHALARAG